VARIAVALIVALILPLLVAAQTIYRTPDGQSRKMGNPQYDGRFVFTRIRYGGRGGFGFFGGGSWNHDYPAADFYISDALETLTRMRVNAASTNVLELEDNRIFDNPVLYVSEPGYWRISDKGAANLRLHLLKGGLVIFDDFEHQDEFDNMGEGAARAAVGQDRHPPSRLPFAVRSQEAGRAAPERRRRARLPRAVRQRRPQRPHARAGQPQLRHRGVLGVVRGRAVSG
jgi:hypothetical protein